MAEAARVLEDLQEPISERTRTALGNVIDLEQARQKQRMRRRRMKQQPAKSNIDRFIGEAVPSATTSANDNTASTQVARGSRVGGSAQTGTPLVPPTRKLANTPTRQHAPRTPLALATELQSAQSQDRRAMEALPQPTESGGRAFLELEPQSYAKRTNAQERERKRQERMMQTSEAFLSPGGAANDNAAPQAAETPQTAQQAPAAEPQAGIAEQARTKGMLQRAARESREQIAAVEAAQGQFQDLRRSGQSFMKIINWSVKIISGAGSEVVLPLIWLIFTLNVETINILFFRIDLPLSLNAFTNIAGINLSVDRKHVWTAANLLTVFITCFVDFFVFLIILPTLLMVVIATILLIFGFTEVLGFLNVGV